MRGITGGSSKGCPLEVSEEGFGWGVKLSEMSGKEDTVVRGPQEHSKLPDCSFTLQDVLTCASIWVLRSSKSF